jgi:hypothetical protein
MRKVAPAPARAAPCAPLAARPARPLAAAAAPTAPALPLPAPQVTVQAGCRVQQVADHLLPHGLTLQNYASIREQQIGGFTQVSAHGTGATVPPVDEQVRPPLGRRAAEPSAGAARCGGAPPRRRAAAPAARRPEPACAPYCREEDSS